MTDKDDRSPTVDMEEILNEARARAERRNAEEADDDVKIYQPKSETEDEPPLRRHDTRILDFVRHRSERDKNKEKKKNEPANLEGQMVFEGMEDPVPEEEPEEVPAAPRKDPEQELEERLQDARREKVENFRLIQNEQTAPSSADTEAGEAGEPASTEELVLEDYNNYSETEAVWGELSYRRRTGRFWLFVAGLLEFVLMCLMLLFLASDTVPMEPITFLSLNLALLVALLLVANRVVADGMSGLLRLRAEADSVTVLAAFAAIAHTVMQFLNLTEVANGAVTLYNAVAGLGLFLAMCGRQYRISRICRNFKFVSYKSEKFAAVCVESSKQKEQLGRFLNPISAPEIVALKKCDFLTSFMANSYEDEGQESLFCRFSPVVLILSALFSVAYVFFGGESANWWSAVGVFAALLCAASPAYAVAGANLPFFRVCKKLVSRGGMLVGWKAADRFSDVNALVVDASDVFPGETVCLHGIKTFAGARIDEAILDAAAVSIEAGGPLAAVFCRVIENRMDMLQDVDTLLYEQEMGLSGWVGGRRVLVGNRRLLENHGVDVPSRDYEMRYTKDNRQLVYLSTGGELCAMFVVSYTADPRLADALNCLTRSGISLLIRTCDPNVTQDLVRDTFQIDEDAVRVLDSPAGRVYETVSQPTDRMEAMLACDGRLEGVGVALSLCRRLRKRVLLTGVLQMVGAGLGLLLTALSVAVKIPLSPLFMVAHLLLWAAITGIVARFFPGN